VTAEKIGALALELLILALLGGLYYLWQRRRILHGPRGWRSDRLVEVHHLALNCDRPEAYGELVPFLDVCEAKLAAGESLDDAFINRWRAAALPEDVLTLLEECWEWANPSQ
jgi:hypothetical protein